jgi:capsular polysaccharide biosynthesis protein
MYNYYHWLYDALPRLKIIESNSDINQNAKYYVPNIEFQFQKETLDLIGINPDQIISGKEMPCIRADEAIVTTQINYPRKLRPWTVDFLREKFLHHASSVQFSPFVYISRGDAPNQRKLLNEKELLDKLIPLGFQSYKLSEFSVKDQISLFSNAAAVVGVHGAGMANLTFCKLGTVVFELFSENYQPKTYKGISDYLTLEYHNIITTPTGKYKNSPVFQPIELPEKEMDRIKKRFGKIYN